MADIEVKQGKKGGTKRKKLSTTVDLTPMVDLGFLLITFFMFTTTMAKPKTMEIIMPSKKKTDKPNKVKDYTAMTVLLGKKNKVYYYYGIGSDPKNPPKIELTDFKPQGGLRDAIIKLKKNVAETKQRDLGVVPGVEASDQATILIKPDTSSTYADMVNALDEMQINGIETYALIDITKEDRNFIKLKDNVQSGGE
jgi:biopolymer transport protein ExbD